jgi:hypothetical protein
MELSKNKIILLSTVGIILLIFIVMAALDFSRISKEKKRLNDIAVQIGNMLSKDIDISTIERVINKDSGKYSISISVNDSIIVTSYVDIYTPGLNLILSNPHKVTIEYTIITG